MSEISCAASCERSHWGLFDRVVKTVRANDDQHQAYRSLLYHCGTKTVELYQPLQGRLMHGDFARKISPSEEALATYILKRPKMFQGRKVLVVGAGLGLAGLVCASCTKAQEVMLTDGDPEVVKVLQSSLQLNNASMESKNVAVQQLLWDRTEHWPDRASYDLVLGADVVYLEDLHLPLLDMMARVLRPGGHGLIFASKRHGSLENFVASSKSVFGNVEVSLDYDAEVERAIGRASKCFPIFVKISRPSQAADSDSVQRICERFAQLREQQQQEVRKAKQRQQQQLLRRRARSESLLLQREQRLNAPVEEVEEVVPVPPVARVPLVPRAELEGRSDWGLFSRSVQVKGDVKEMTYQCGKYQVQLRRHVDSPKITCGEEALAAWVLKARGLRQRRVLELGAGAGLAGLVAAFHGCKHVELTDGDPIVVEALDEAVAKNHTNASMRVRQLKFGEVPSVKKFDWIIASEILEKDSHAAILRTARKLLKSSGSLVIMACGSSMDIFLREAAGTFPKIQLKRDYDEEVCKLLHGMPCRPKLAILRRPAKPKKQPKVKETAKEVEELDCEGSVTHSQASEPQDAEKEAEETVFLPVEGPSFQDDSPSTSTEVVRGHPLKHSRSDSSLARQRTGEVSQRLERLRKGPSSDERWMDKDTAAGKGGPLVRPLIQRVKSLPLKEGKFLTLSSEL